MELILLLGLLNFFIGLLYPAFAFKYLKFIKQPNRLKAFGFVIVFLIAIGGVGMMQNSDKQIDSQNQNPQVVEKETTAQKKNTEPEENTASSPKKWAPNIEYTYYSDGSCVNKENTKCIDMNTMKDACDLKPGLSKGALQSIQFVTGGDDKALAKAGNFSNLVTGWSGKKCIVFLDATGIVNGTSKKANFWGTVNVFTSTDDEKLIIQYVGWFQ